MSDLDFYEASQAELSRLRRERRVAAAVELMVSLQMTILALTVMALMLYATRLLGWRLMIRKLCGIGWIILAMIWFSSVIEAAQSLQLNVDSNGQVSIIIAVAFTDQRILDNRSTFGSASIWYLVLPFGLGANASVSGPSDLSISLLKNVEDCAIVSVLAPSSVETFTLKFQHVPVLKATSEGKARISLDTSFRFMSQAEKAILNALYTISDFEFSVTFPTKYQDDQVVYRPFDFVREDLGRRYTLPLTAYAKLSNQQNTEDIWIVFPNPIKSSIDSYKIIISVLSGFAVIGVSLRTLKKDNRRRWYAASVLSFLVLLGLSYFFMQALRA